MLIAIWPLAICLLGLLAFVLSQNNKVIRLGEIAYFVGLFWTVYELASKTLHVG